MSRIAIEEILRARERIAPFIRRTPLLPFDYLGTKVGKDITLKCENLQRTGSFKIRGASNCILENMAQAKKNGVVTASAGNHAQGVAATCKHLGIKATIVMPVITPAIKIQNTQRWGAEIVLVGTVYDEAFEHAKELAAAKELVLVHPFRDPLIMAGQASVGLELIEDPAFAQTEAVVISLGGGGLISGIGAALKASRPELKVYGVTAKNSPGAFKSFHEKKCVREEVKFTLAEGVANKGPDDFMLGYLSEVVDDVFSISEESIAYAIAVLAEHGKLVVEGAGALPVAAVLENLIPEKNITLVLSGGNVDLPALSGVMQRGLVEQGRLVRLVINIPDRPGGLAAVTQVLADRRANILQIFHQRATLHAAVGEVEIEVNIETRGPEHTREITHALAERGFRVHRVA